MSTPAQGSVSLPRDLSDEYERLRDVAGDPSRVPGGVAGLAILVRKGMAAWMHACASATTTTDAAAVDRGSPIPAAAQRDVVDVLAAMVLTNAPEVTA